MSDVSVIGTGAMGSALVEVLSASGAQVMVWNRTREKAEALSGPRVRSAGSAGEALMASPLTIVSVSDHELARTLVEETGADLEGKVVASTSFVTPDQARAFSDEVSSAGGHYLDLAIPSGPSQVRSGAGIFFVSGDRAAYEEHRERFERIGMATHLGEALAAAYVGEMPVVLAFLPMAVCLLQGLRICEHHELSVEWFKSTVLEYYPRQIRWLMEGLTDEAAPSTTDVEVSVDIMADHAAEYAAYLRKLGLDSGMYDALQRLFAAASEAGRGDADWTTIA